MLTAQQKCRRVLIEVFMKDNCKPGCEVKCNKLSVIATSFAKNYCKTGLIHTVSETIKVPCYFCHLIDFMTVSNDLSLNSV